MHFKKSKELGLVMVQPKKGRNPIVKVCAPQIRNTESQTEHKFMFLKNSQTTKLNCKMRLINRYELISDSDNLKEIEEVDLSDSQGLFPY